MLHHRTYQGNTAGTVLQCADCAPCVDNVRCHGACALPCTAAPQPDMSETTSAGATQGIQNNATQELWNENSPEESFIDAKLSIVLL